MVDKSTKYTDRKGKWQTTVCTIRIESYYMTVYKKEVLKQFITLRSLVILRNIQVRQQIWDKMHWLNSIKPYWGYRAVCLSGRDTYCLFLFTERSPIAVVLNADCWDKTSDVHGFGGTPHNVTTLTECQAVCVSNLTCVAIDWQPTNAPNTCWILTSTVTGDTMHIGVIDHYELYRDCLGKWIVLAISILATRLSCCSL